MAREQEKRGGEDGYAYREFDEALGAAGDGPERRRR